MVLVWWDWALPSLRLCVGHGKGLWQKSPEPEAPVLTTVSSSLSQASSWGRRAP